MVFREIKTSAEWLYLRIKSTPARGKWDGERPWQTLKFTQETMPAEGGEARGAPMDSRSWHTLTEQFGPRRWIMRARKYWSGGRLGMLARRPQLCVLIYLVTWTNYASSAYFRRSVSTRNELSGVNITLLGRKSVRYTLVKTKPISHCAKHNISAPSIRDNF